MIVIAVADIHGDAEALERVLLAEPKIDLLVLLGDITNFGNEEDAERVLDRARQHISMIFAVDGNCDPEAVGRFLVRESVSLHERAVVFGDIAWGGAGKSLPCPGGTPNESEEESLAASCAKAADSVPAGMRFALVTHQPPLGTVCDRSFLGHVGSRAIREFIEQKKPVLSLSGHIHEGAGVDRIGSCIVANPGPVRRGGYIRVEADSGLVKAVDLKKCR